jgi:hypothetical protein
MSLSTALGLLSVGTILFQDISDAGVLSPEIIDAGNGTAFEVQSNSNTEEMISRRRDTAGQVLATASQIQPPKCSIKLNTSSASNLRKLWLGTQKTLAEAAVTVTGQTISLSKAGWTQITKTTSGVVADVRNLDLATVVLTNAAASTTYVRGTDYEVDEWAGMLRAVDGGAIADADLATLKVTATSLPVSGVAISASTKATIKTRIYFLGRNTVDNSRSRLVLWEATLKPKGGIDLLSDKWAEFEFEASLTTPKGKTEPYFYEQY